MLYIDIYIHVYRYASYIKIYACIYMYIYPLRHILLYTTETVEEYEKGWSGWMKKVSPRS